jgi:hypothetical protein
MEVDKTPKGSVGALLEKKAAERREAMRLKDEERKRHRDRRRSRSRGRRRKRRPGRTSSGGASGSRSCSSGSSHSFRKPSTRGEDELWRQSKEYGQAPGADSLASGVPHHRGGRRRAARQEVAHGKLRELVSKGRRQDK